MAGTATTTPPTGATMATTEDELAAMHQFIENALDLKIKGNATNYNYLIQQLQSKQPDSVQVRRKIYSTLPRCISTIAKETQAYQQLLDALFKFDFLVDEAETKAFTSFIVHLVSSNTVYVTPTLQMLVRNLARPLQLPPHLAAAVALQAQPAVTPGKGIGITIGSSFGGSVVMPPAAPVAPQIDVEACIQKRYDVAHDTLGRVLKLAPTATNVLFPILCEHFPHKRHDAPFQTAYLRNMLKVSMYVPGLQERIFGLIIDQLVAVDVEIKLDEKEEDVFTMDDFLDDELLPCDGTTVDEMADKLDQMMLVMFEHIEQLVGANAKSNDVSNVRIAAQVLKHLLKVFEHSILNTHRSKYPQFLLFYVCKMDPQFQDVFISQLLAASLDPQTPAVTRHSCGAYLASFLARAKYIPVSYIQKALYHLLKWMHDQMDIYEQTQNPSSIEAEAEVLEGNKRGFFQESIFISTLQTVCYMLCFRGLELAVSPNGYEFLRSLGWERLLMTPAYCPLAMCQQSVAAEFINFAETMNLVSDECIEAIDQATSANAIGGKKAKTMERSAVPTSSQASSAVAAFKSSTILATRQPLETFFPFDPYLLRRSFKFIGPLYFYWKHADPNSSENCDALNTVKQIIREMEENEEEEDEEAEEEANGEELAQSEDERFSLSSSANLESYKETSYMEERLKITTTTHMSVSLGSSIDEYEDTFTYGSTPKRYKKKSRLSFDPSPALSCSSPPSRLPPLGAVGAFQLDFDEEEEDGF